MSFQNTQSNLFVSTQVTKELKIGRLSPEWWATAFSKYSTNFIYFHTGHKRKENWKAFTLMATMCLFKILYQIHLIPHRSQKNWNLEGFHLNDNQVPFQNTRQNLSISTQVTKEKKIGKLFKTLYQRYIRINNSCQLKKNKKIVSNEKQEKGSRCKLSSGPWWLSSHLWELSMLCMLLSSATQAMRRAEVDWGLVAGLEPQLFAHPAVNSYFSNTKPCLFQNSTPFLCFPVFKGKPSMCHNWSSSSNKIFTRPTPQSHYNMINATGGSQNGSRQFIFNLINQ